MARAVMKKVAAAAVPTTTRRPADGSASASATSSDAWHNASLMAELVAALAEPADARAAEVARRTARCQRPRYAGRHMREAAAEDETGDENLRETVRGD